MKTQKTAIPTDALISQYLPEHHADSFQCEFDYTGTLTTEDLQVLFWTHSPKWVQKMFALRNALVKPFGLDTTKDESGLIACIRTGTPHQITTRMDSTPTETVIKMDDSHLYMYFSLQWVRVDASTQRVIATTLVHFKNAFGRFYFTIIAPFHNKIVKSMLEHVIAESIDSKGGDATD